MYSLVAWTRNPDTVGSRDREPVTLLTGTRSPKQVGRSPSTIDRLVLTRDLETSHVRRPVRSIDMRTSVTDSLCDMSIGLSCRKKLCLRHGVSIE